MTTAPLISRLLVYTAVGAVIAGAAMPHRAAAASFYLQDQSVKGLGRAYSGEVADQGAESLWWNPAAIARGPNEIYVGENSILTSATVNDRGSNILYPGHTSAGAVGGDPSTFNPVEFGVVPNGAVAYHLGDRFAVGLSTAAPYDFTTNYSPASFARYNSLKSRLTTIDIAATGAMKVTDWLDLGVSVNTEYTSANLGNALPGLTPGSADSQQDLRGDGWNVGYTVGGQAHFGAWEFGASYKSAMDHDLSGVASISPLIGATAANTITLSGVKAHFTTPWIATIGARYHLTPQLTLDVQGERFGWSEFKAIDYTVLGTANAVPENYRDTTSGAIGAEYALNARVTFRAGVAYDQSPLNPTYRDTRVPDGDRWLYTLGVSAKVRPNLTLDASGGYVQFRGAFVNNTTAFNGGTTIVNELASVGANAKILSLGMRYNF